MQAVLSLRLYATLLDTALGGALLSLVTPEEWCATAEIVVSYIRPSKEGTTLLPMVEWSREVRVSHTWRGKSLIRTDS